MLEGQKEKKKNPFSGIFSFFKNTKEKSLFERKRQLVQELAVAEQRFLKRQLSEESYKTFIREKQQELIKIDAMLTQQAKIPEVSKEELASVDPKNRHLLKQLLGQREKTQKELEFAQNKYLKRKIDEKTYLGIMHSCQAKIIEIDSQINALKGTRSIKSIFEEMKEKLKETEKQNKRHEIERIALEILEQVEKSKP